ncbi:MAG: 16S rRNA (cytidine(1402)-2'-O)-methyltransferase [Bacteroidia bacterium]|nr:16S rRNA (cytidine(1402)-2'-O)-methyltransferase [Bacteroidia bacterium]MDW8015360.1 16S rRNA (cytidine(1402)-2'-O)-methyltransferase [Bacteroidia bacterium]
MQGLWVIPTPLGNLRDITLRALDVLNEVDVLWCEDTRTVRKLLSHFSIQKKLLRSLHIGNEHRVLERLFQEAKHRNWKVGLVTEGGMPGISDPGFLPIREAHRRHIPVYVLPGPTAFAAAVVASGLPMERFIFEGFFPRRQQQAYIQAFLREERTVIWYESPHRLVRTLKLLKESLGEHRWGCIVRELTKIHEEVRRDTLGALHAHYASNPPRGEVVLVVAGAAYTEASP